MTLAGLSVWPMRNGRFAHAFLISRADRRVVTASNCVGIGWGVAAIGAVAAGLVSRRPFGRRGQIWLSGTGKHGHFQMWRHIG